MQNAFLKLGILFLCAIRLECKSWSRLWHKVLFSSLVQTLGGLREILLACFNIWDIFAIRVKGASPLAAELPEDILKRILASAFPLPGTASRLACIDFEFSLCRTAHNSSHLNFLQLGRRSEFHSSNTWNKTACNSWVCWRQKPSTYPRLLWLAQWHNCIIKSRYHSSSKLGNYELHHCPWVLPLQYQVTMKRPGRLTFSVQICRIQRWKVLIVQQAQTNTQSICVAIWWSSSHLDHDVYRLPLW